MRRLFDLIYPPAGLSLGGALAAAAFWVILILGAAVFVAWLDVRRSRR